jgi:hypothetical protein
MRDGLSGEYIVDATVTVQVFGLDGIAVSDIIACPRDTGTIANYVGTIDNRQTEILVEGKEYYVDVTATHGDATGYRRVRRLAARIVPVVPGIRQHWRRRP